jgi:DNA-binding IclR family transcriptional regulator
MSQVPSASRALAVLRLLASSAQPLDASTIARTLELPRSSTYHLLAAMAEDGFVTYLPDDRRWGLGVTAFQIGSAYLRQGSIERLARPLLVRLVGRVGEIAQLGVLYGAETLYLLKEQPPHHATLVTDVGVRMPAHLTASGRSMLAHLPAAQVRARCSPARSWTARVAGLDHSPNCVSFSAKTSTAAGRSKTVTSPTASPASPPAASTTAAARRRRSP